MSEKEDTQPKQKTQMTEHEKRSNLLSALALAVAILVPVLTATFGIGQFMERVDSGSGKADIEAQLKAALQTLGDREKQALEEIEKARSKDGLSQLREQLHVLARRPGPRLGDWEDRKVGEVYQAETDGFLAAYTGGDVNRFICLETEASEAAIRVLDPRGNCNTTGLRTRALPYDGSVTPVKEGHFYIVRIRSGDKGRVTVYWLPFYN